MGKTQGAQNTEASKKQKIIRKDLVNKIKQNFNLIIDNIIVEFNDEFEQEQAYYKLREEGHLCSISV